MQIVGQNPHPSTRERSSVGARPSSAAPSNRTVKKHEIAVQHGAGVAGLGLELGAGGNQLAGHGRFLMLEVSGILPPSESTVYSARRILFAGGEAAARKAAQADAAHRPRGLTRRMPATDEPEGTGAFQSGPRQRPWR